jgi:hypothetical protein
MNTLFSKESKECSIDSGFGYYENIGSSINEKFVPDILNNFFNDVFPYIRSNKRRLSYVRQLWCLMYVDIMIMGLDSNQKVNLILELKKDPYYKKYIL